jgi:hypothetical protein
MDPILRRRTSILYGARPRAVSLAARPLPANPHERYPLVYAKVALADAVALRICATPGSVGWCPCQRFGPSWSATSVPGQSCRFWHVDTRMVDLPVRAKSRARQATGLQGGSIEAGLKLQDCFSASNSEVVFAIKKPLRHLNLWACAGHAGVVYESGQRVEHESGQKRHGAH